MALVKDSATTHKDNSKPDIIIGCDLIKALGLTLDFAADPPVISWEDATVPIVPQGYWTKECLLETYPLSAISVVEKNFKDKSPGMLPASYGKDQVDLCTLVPSHLKEHQQEELYQLLCTNPFSMGIQVLSPVNQWS
jgi:hypothetical protein